MVDGFPYGGDCDGDGEVGVVVIEFVAVEFVGGEALEEGDGGEDVAVAGDGGERRVEVAGEETVGRGDGEAPAIAFLVGLVGAEAADAGEGGEEGAAGF